MAPIPPSALTMRPAPPPNKPKRLKKQPRSTPSAATATPMRPPPPKRLAAVPPPVRPPLQPEPEPEPKEREPAAVAGDVFAVRLEPGGAAASLRVSAAGFSLLSGADARLLAFEELRRWTNVQGESIVLTTASGEEVWLTTVEGQAICAAADAALEPRLAAAAAAAAAARSPPKLDDGTFAVRLGAVAASLRVAATGFTILAQLPGAEPQVYPFEQLRRWADIEGQAVMLTPLIGEEVQLETAQGQAICAAAEDRAALLPLTCMRSGYAVSLTGGRAAVLHVSADGFQVVTAAREPGAGADAGVGAGAFHSCTCAF